MASSKTLNTRIKQKRDTSANWELKNPVLLNGEIIIVDTASGEMRTKTGDGEKTYTQLPFDDEGTKGGKSLVDINKLLTKDNVDEFIPSNDYNPATKKYVDDKTHKLTEKANTSDVLTKTNTTEFTPTADYHPATKKYVDSNKLSHIANGETIGTVKIGRTGAQKAEGPYSTIIGFSGHTGTGALGSVAIGNGECLAEYTVAMGLSAVAAGENQLVFGKYNVKDTEDKCACIIGNGTSDTARSNAHTVDWSGNAWFAGDIESATGGSLSKKSEAKTYTVTVPTTSWTSTTSSNVTTYKKTITVTGLKATDTPIVDVVLSDTVATAKKQLEAYACLSRVTTATNSITLYCYESAPTTQFTIQLLNVTNRQ